MPYPKYRHRHIRRRRHRPSGPSLIGKNREPLLVQLWLMRALDWLCQRKWKRVHLATLSDNVSEDTLSAVGLGRLAAVVDEDANSNIDVARKKEFLSEVKKHHRLIEQKARTAVASTTVRTNVQTVAKLAGLNATEQLLLTFCIYLLAPGVFRDAVGKVFEYGELSDREAFAFLSAVLKLPLQKIGKCLQPNGALAHSGLLRFDSIGNELTDKIELLSDEFIERMQQPDMTPADLLREYVSPGEKPRLVLGDYRHLADVSVLRIYLKRALVKRQRGVNVLLYGPPGTGKTQLGRVLAQSCRRDLFEVTCVDEDGDPIGDHQRLRAFKLAQCFLSKTLLMFDEAEDVFGNPYAGIFGNGKKTAAQSKGGINRMLEQNTLPTIWISNSPCMDPAYLRRFDIVVEVPVPPKSARERIVRDVGGAFLDEKTLGRIAESESLAPAVVARASEVVNLIRNDLKKNQVAPTFERLVNNVLEVQGHETIKRHDPNRLPEVYDPSFINADFDPASIGEALANARRGRLCLYGAPGTGKTAYGRWIAERMDAPLTVKRASDLMSPFIGMTEKLIADAFENAERDEAVLLIDEVDGFLQDRRDAHRSWEVSQVNEMLTQIESFDGVFIVSTNLMGGLDQAALRRFDFKIKFNFLRPEQAWALLCKHCAALKLAQPDADGDARAQARLARLRNLAPGDFAVAVRQHNLRPFAGADELVTALVGECELKENANRVIGFVG